MSNIHSRLSRKISLSPASTSSTLFKLKSLCITIQPHSRPAKSRVSIYILHKSVQKASSSGASASPLFFSLPLLQPPSVPSYIDEGLLYCRAAGNRGDFPARSARRSRSTRAQVYEEAPFLTWRTRARPTHVYERVFPSLFEIVVLQKLRRARSCCCRAFKDALYTWLIQSALDADVLRSSIGYK